MLSIRRLLEKPGHDAPAADILSNYSTLRRLLLEAITAPPRGTPELATGDFERAAREVLARLDEDPPPLELSGLAMAAFRAALERERRSAFCFRELNGHTQEMVGMLTEAIAYIWGQPDVSVAELRQMGGQIAKVCSLDEVRMAKAKLATCLAAVKEAATERKKATEETVERLHDQVTQPPQKGGSEPRAQPETQAPAVAATEYVAVFKLQRAEHILRRFGDSTVEQLTSLIGDALKPIPGPRDRLMRWKGSSFVIILNTLETMTALRRRLAFTVGRFGQRYVEVGKNSALLAVGIDWVIFPQAQYGSLEAVFAEVDTFLGDKLVRGEATHTG